MENKQPVGRAAMPEKWQTAHTQKENEQPGYRVPYLKWLFCHAWIVETDRGVVFPRRIAAMAKCNRVYVGRLRRAND
jgi:hypothetical protein